MQITFEDKKMKVVHESGVVNYYTKADLEAQRDRRQSQINDLNADLVNTGFQIAEIDASETS